MAPGSHSHFSTPNTSPSPASTASLSTIEGDIENLGKLLEGETITIQGQQYQVAKGGFELVRKT